MKISVVQKENISRLLIGGEASEARVVDIGVTIFNAGSKIVYVFDFSTEYLMLSDEEIQVYGDNDEKLAVEDLKLPTSTTSSEGIGGAAVAITSLIASLVTYKLTSASSEGKQL